MAGLGAPVPANVQQELIEAQDLVADIQDELKLTEDKLAEKDQQMNAIIDKNLKREKALLECLEALVGYVTMLEQNIVQPAIGNLLEELKNHFERISYARDAATSKIGRIAGGVRLGKLLTHLHNPSANIIAMEQRRKSFLEGYDNETVRVYQPEDAYVLAASLLQDKEQMQQILRFCVQSIGGQTTAASQQHQQPASVQSSDRLAREASSLQTQMGLLKQQNDSLKSEVQRLHTISQQSAYQAQDSGRLQAEYTMLLQEKDILSQQLNSLEETIRQERRILNQKAESMQNSVAQLTAERNDLKSRVDSSDFEAQKNLREKIAYQQQVGTLDEQIQQLQQQKSSAERRADQADGKILLLEQERAIVKQNFDTLNIALSQGDSDKKYLQDQLNNFKDNILMGGDTNDPLREALRMEREENHRLRLEVELMQRENSVHHTGGSLSPDEMIASKTENLKLRNELERQRESFTQMLDASKNRENELAAKCTTLTGVADRLKMELEQTILTVGKNNEGGGISSLGITGDGIHNKITAFEMNMNKLSTDVGSVGGQIQSLDHQTPGGSPSQLHQRLQDERAMFEAERTECDNIVKQMTEELEHLVQENQQLKQQQQQQQHHDPKYSSDHLSATWGRHR